MEIRRLRTDLLFTYKLVFGIINFLMFLLLIFTERAAAHTNL